MTAIAGGECTMRTTSILMLGVVLGAATLVGCGGDRATPADRATATLEAAAATAEERYTLRGVITALDDDPASRRVFLRHEAIADFRSAGEVVGMDSMTMGFELAPETARDGLEVGAKVECEWVVTPDSPAGSIVRIELLDPATEFDFGEGGAHDP